MDHTDTFVLLVDHRERALYNCLLEVTTQKDTIGPSCQLKECELQLANLPVGDIAIISRVWSSVQDGKECVETTHAFGWV